MAALAARLVRHARSRYRIGPNEAEDLVQSSVTAYLEGNERYKSVPNQDALLFGIFRLKCLEHIDRSVREQRRMRRMISKPDVARENPWIRPSNAGESPSVLEGLIRDEERREIRLAVASLRPPSRWLVSLIIDDGATRQEMIAITGLNRNTLDSRLHNCRLELRKRLRERSLPAMERPRAEPRRAVL
jgi:RNA polymerase sigma-70 factor (ECF subfamily)